MVRWDRKLVWYVWKEMERNGCAHIIVEHRMRVAVFVEEPLCVCHSEVFEVQQAVRVMCPDELNESAPDK